MLNLSDSSLPQLLNPIIYMSDGSEIFPHLWRHFLRHEHIREWLMRMPPYQTSNVSPSNVSQGIAFCCNFTVPDLWKDYASTFSLGEMFIPNHPYRHFMCGSVVAATPMHKHLICALGSAAARNKSTLPSYRSRVRRMVMDIGSSRSINMIEFSWMEDGMLIVTAKMMVPPPPGSLRKSAGCTGSFALFSNVIPGGALPAIPDSFVSFVETPRCPLCFRQGALGCYCSAPALDPSTYSSAVWPPTLKNDIQDVGMDSYFSIRRKLASIQRVAHVKITVHVVTKEVVQRSCGPPQQTYRLGPSRFVVKAVIFRPSTSFETDTLRQVADKLRLLRAGTLRLPFLLSQEKDQYLVDPIPDQRSRTSLAGFSNSFIDPTMCSSLSSLPSSSLDYQIYTGGSSSTSQFITPTSSTSEDIIDSMTCKFCFGTKILGEDTLNLPSCICGSKSSTEVSKSRDCSSSGSKAVKPINMKSSKEPKCPVCEKTFSQRGSLNRHWKNIHEEKKIPCQYCTMTFGQMFDLKRHQKRKHPDKRIAKMKCERIETRPYGVAVGGLDN